MRAVSELQGLVRKYLDRLCDALAANDAKGKPSDMLFALRCFTLDTIIVYCFAQDVHATEAAEFQVPITVAMGCVVAGVYRFSTLRIHSKVGLQHARVVDQTHESHVGRSG